MVRAVLLLLLDSMLATVLTLMSINLIPKILWSETYLGQDGPMGFSEDISSGSMRKLFLACVLEILVSLCKILSLKFIYIKK